MNRSGYRHWRRAACALAVWVCAAGCDNAATPPRIEDDAVIVDALAPRHETSATADKQHASSTGWPNLFGPTHDSISPERNLLNDWPADGPPVHWRKSIGAGYSAPVVLGDRLVLFHRQGDREIVDCLNAETGDTFWSFDYPTAYQCPYEYSSGPYSTPALEADRVYAWGAAGVLHCLDLRDGSLIWRRHLSEEFAVAEGLFAVGSSPLVWDDRLILIVGGQDQNAGIVALDKTTGRTLWTATDHAAGYATPVAATIHGRPHLFALTAAGLVSLDPTIGAVDWTIPFRPKKVDSANAVTPLVVDDLVFVTAGPGAGCFCVQVQPDGGYREIWKGRRVLDSQFNNLIGIDGAVYGYPSTWNGSAYFRSLDLRTGKLNWKWPSDINRGSSIAVDGHFILLGETGQLALLKIDPEQPRPVCVTTEPVLAAPCYSAPALHRGLLYLRNETTLLCLNLRREKPTTVISSTPTQ